MAKVMRWTERGMRAKGSVKGTEGGVRLGLQVFVPVGVMTPVMAERVGELVKQSMVRALREAVCKEAGHVFGYPGAPALCTVCWHFVGGVPGEEVTTRGGRAG